MAIEFKQAPEERGKSRKVLDYAGRAEAFVAVPVLVVATGGAVLAGSFGAAAITGAGAFMEGTKIKEMGKKPREQSWWNPERLWDKVWTGEQKTRMALAAS